MSSGTPPQYDGTPLGPGCALDGNGGVGFLVALHLAPYVSVLKSSFKNQLWIRVAASRSSDSDLFIGSAYMPQEGAPLEVAEEAWAALTESWLYYSTKGAVMALGDFNAKCGKPTNDTERPLLGPYLPACDRSRNGALLAKLVAQVEAVILNGHSRLRSGKPWHTFSRFNSATGAESNSMLDYILVSPHLRISGKCAEFGVDCTDLDSDHYLTWGRVRCPRRREHKTSKPRKVFKLRLLHPSPRGDDDPANYQADYEAKLREAFLTFQLPDVPHDSDEEVRVALADAVSKDWIERVFSALKSSVGEATINKRFSRSWFDKECRTAISERRHLYRLYKANPCVATWNAYKTERLRVRKLIVRKKREDWLKFIEEVKDDFGSNLKGCWSKVRRLLPKTSNSSSHPIRMADGRLATSTKQRRAAAVDYREELGKALYRPTFEAGFKQEKERELQRMMFSSPQQDHNEDLDGKITPRELQAVLAKAGCGKAAGKDGTRNAMFKYGGKTMSTLLLELFNWLRDLEVTPTDWGHAVIINLFKDGDPADLGNYRGIALISCLGKLYLAIWAARLSTHMEPRLSEEQGGFRRSRSTVDSIAALHDATLRRRKANLSSYLLFVDFRKAFDTVWRDGLWTRLWSMGVRGKAWRVIKAVYRDIRLSVLVDGEHTRLVPAEQGVRQGCPLSPILFYVFVDELVVMLKARGCGVAFNSDDEIRRKLAALMYADDVVLLAASKEELQTMIDVVFEFCNKWRIEVNTKKSQVMVVHPSEEHRARDQGASWTFGDTQLEVVDQYKYLGVSFSNDLTWTKQSLRGEGLSTSAEHSTVSERTAVGSQDSGLGLCGWLGPSVWHRGVGCPDPQTQETTGVYSTPSEDQDVSATASLVAASGPRLGRRSQPGISTPQGQTPIPPTSLGHGRQQTHQADRPNSGAPGLLAQSHWPDHQKR